MGEPIRILVVDPDDAVAGECVKALVSRGWAVDRAASCAQAMEFGKQWIYDIAVIELKLPDGTGSDAWSELHALQPRLKSIVITQSPTLYTSIQVLERGVIAYLLKPLSLGLLCGLVEEACRRSPKDRVTNGLALKMVNLTLFLSTLTTLRSPDEIFNATCVNWPAIVKSDLLVVNVWGDGQSRGVARPYTSYPPQRGLTDEQSAYINWMMRESVRRRKSIVLNKAARCADTESIPEDLELGAVAAVPLASPQTIYGAIAVVRFAECDAFSSVDTESLSAIAHVIAVSLDSVRLPMEMITDEETGTYSSTYLAHFIAQETKRAARFPRRFSMVRLGIQGRQDQTERRATALDTKVLRDMANLARKRLRASDVIARQSEGNIAVMLAEADGAAVGHIADRLKDALETGMRGKLGSGTQVDALVIEDWDRGEELDQ